MMLEILERSGHIEGQQPASLTPRHTRIRSPCSQGSVTEHSSQTWHKKGKECHILGSEPQKKNQVKEKGVISAMTQAGQPVTHRKYLPPYGFPLPFDTCKQSCLYTTTTWEGGRETRFHITRDGFVNVIHSAVAACAWGDLSDLQRLPCIFIQVPSWKFQHPLPVGFTIARRMNLPF